MEGRGASGVKSANLVDSHDPAFKTNRALDKEDAAGADRGNIGGASAQDRTPESATTVAAEAPSRN